MRLPRLRGKLLRSDQQPPDFEASMKRFLSHGRADLTERRSTDPPTIIDIISIYWLCAFLPTL